MQPAWQSPQPIVTATRQPTTAGDTSYQADWPMRSGSVGPIPEKRGSWARTRATASASVSSAPPGVADAAGVAAGDVDAAGGVDAGPAAPPHPATLMRGQEREHGQRGKRVADPRQATTVVHGPLTVARLHRFR